MIGYRTALVRALGNIVVYLGAQTLKRAPGPVEADGTYIDTAASTIKLTPEEVRAGTQLVPED